MPKSADKKITTSVVFWRRREFFSHKTSFWECVGTLFEIFGQSYSGNGPFLQNKHEVLTTSKKSSGYKQKTLKSALSLLNPLINPQIKIFLKIITPYSNDVPYCCLPLHRRSENSHEYFLDTIPLSPQIKIFQKSGRVTFVSL